MPLHRSATDWCQHLADIQINTAKARQLNYLLKLYLEAVACVGNLLYTRQYGGVDLVEAIPHLLGRRTQETVDVRTKFLRRLAFHLRPHDQVLRILVIGLRVGYTDRHTDRHRHTHTHTHRERQTVTDTHTERDRHIQ